MTDHPITAETHEAAPTKLRLESIDDVLAALAARHYIADRSLATAIYLALICSFPLTCTLCSAKSACSVASSLNGYVVWNWAELTGPLFCWTVIDLLNVPVIDRFEASIVTDFTLLS